jgi:hypothetical protein
MLRMMPPSLPLSMKPPDAALLPSQEAGADASVQGPALQPRPLRYQEAPRWGGPGGAVGGGHPRAQGEERSAWQQVWPSQDCRWGDHLTLLLTVQI